MEFEETFPVIDGCRIRMRRGGKGAPILYLHGANGVPSVQPFLVELARDHDVIVPEHPGFGQSDEPEWLDDIHDLAYFYLDLLDHYGLGNVHVIGSSIGGWLAMEMAVREPSRFASLLLVGSAGIRIPEAQPGDIFLWTPEQAAANTYADPELARLALSSPMDPDIALKNKHTVAALAWGPRLHDPALHKWLGRLRMPVQLAWGEADKVMPLPYAHALQRLIPQAKVEVFPRCGHLPQVERPAEFVALASRFISAAQDGAADSTANAIANANPKAQA